MAVDTAHEAPHLIDLTENERLIPIMPMIYVAWSDGDLTPDEIRNIRSTAAEQDWLDADAKERLGKWLDPEDPPKARHLERLLRSIRETFGDEPTGERMSLAELGVQIAELERRRQGEDGAESPESWMTDDTREALEDLEEALGILGTDACRDLLTPRDERPKAPVDEPAPTFDVDEMTALLDGEYRQRWEQIRGLLLEPEFDYLDDPTTEEHRDQVNAWLEILADEDLGSLAYPEDVGGEGSMGDFITAFEALAMFDQSLVVKFGVQFGLFGGSINFLGTERHFEEYLEDVGNLELPGGFAMTELGHGSNVRELETVARYDDERDEFVVDTPSERARKEWIGGAARDARMVTVFAQLEVDEEDHGVHAFLVPVRDDDGDLLDGVRIEDCGHKMGLNGVDNGRIWFDEVRIPRENLLNRYGGVDETGEYDSDIPSPGKRFFTMIGTLVGGRVSVTGASVTAMKSALTIATRYGALRRQFGPAGEPEQAILDYRSHKRRLMPRIAAAYGLSFATQHLKRRYLDKGEDDRREVEALAAGLKSYATERSIDAIQTARECCGGMGYLSTNRISELRRDVDIYATFEGDNTVLMLLVARGLLSQFQSQFEDERFFSIVRYVADQAATAVQELNPVVRRRTESEHLRSVEFQRSAFEYREKDLLRSAAQRMRRRLDEGMPAFDAFDEIQDHLLSLSRAHIERVVYDQFQEGVERADGDQATMLEQLRDVFAIERLYDDIGWYLESEYMAPVKARAIRNELNELCEEVRPQAVHCVDAFGIPEPCLDAPIAFGDETP